jgi:hypothetical protein
VVAKRKTTPAARSGAGAVKFAPGEHVRTVPLHHPKPAMSVDELGRLRSELPVASARARLTYHRGRLLTSVRVFTIFWGTTWGSAAGAATRQSVNTFFQAVLVSPLLDQLREYGVPGQSIGHGSFIGTRLITARAPVGSVTDSVIRRQLKAWIAARTVPKNTKNTLYFIYLDPGIVSIMGGSKSCQNYCGYHDAVGRVCYAVMPYPACAGCLGGMEALDALTGTSSHELCEAITDPVPGAGWYDDVHGEIGDICAWNFKKVAGYTVQLEWSNAQNRCV